MEKDIKNHPIHQYSLNKILIIWAAATVPMGLLGWVVAPAMAKEAAEPGIVRLVVLTIGLIWQFILVLILLYQETGSLRWSIIKPRLWLVTPFSQQSSRPDKRLWWWIIPLLIITAIYQMAVSGAIGRVWVSILPFLAEPPGFAFDILLNSPASRMGMIGNWNLLFLFVLMALFNTFLGEELLFRGILLPRMSGEFGKWDWAANGILFGLYHIHQPWSILSSSISGAILFAFPSRYFRSSWFGIILHSGQSVFFSFLILGLVLGLA